MSKLATIYYAINWINSLFELILVWMLWINSLVFLYKLQLLCLVFIFPNLFLEIWTLFKENSRVDFVKIPISKTNFPNFLHHNNFDWCWCWCCSTTTQTSSKLNFKRQGETWKKSIGRYWNWNCFHKNWNVDTTFNWDEEMYPKEFDANVPKITEFHIK